MSDESGHSFIGAWARVSEDLEAADTTDVGVDSSGRVFAFSRSEKSVLVFETDGALSHRWGGPGVFDRPHSIYVGPEDTIWVTDTGTNDVREYSPEGELLRSIDPEPVDNRNFSGRPFAECTHVTVDAETGEIFVSDGYLNAAVHRFSPEGKLIKSWGSPGCGPGQFCVPHNIATDSAGLIFVADRHNGRIQIFDRDGELQKIVYDVGLPNALHFGAHDGAPALYVVELSNMTFPTMTDYQAADEWIQIPSVGHRVTIRGLDGSLLATLAAGGAGTADGQLAGPHGIAADAAGSVFLAELKPRPRIEGFMTSVLKLERESPAS